MTIWTPRSVRVSRVVWIGETLETFFWDLLAILYLTQRLFEEDKLVKTVLMLGMACVKPGQYLFFRIFKSFIATFGVLYHIVRSWMLGYSFFLDDRHLCASMKRFWTNLFTTTRLG